MVEAPSGGWYWTCNPGLECCLLWETVTEKERHREERNRDRDVERYKDRGREIATETCLHPCVHVKSGIWRCSTGSWCEEGSCLNPNPWWKCIQRTKCIHLEQSQKQVKSFWGLFVRSRVANSLGHPSCLSGHPYSPGVQLLCLKSHPCQPFAD